MKIDIKDRWTNEVLHTVEVDNSDPTPLRTAILKLVADGASLDGARLDGASLDCASLVGARLDGASLDCASLVGASLVGASLDGARLDGASLDCASLVGARLVGARLDGASLVGASLVGARLDGASLVGARLDGASLVGARLELAALATIRADVRAVLDAAPDEVTGLLQKLLAGEVNGSCYEGECACLIGTIANVRGCHYDLLGPGLRPDSSRPAERWFLAIRPGCTPQHHQPAAITVGWIREWLREHDRPVPTCDAFTAGLIRAAEQLERRDGGTIADGGARRALEQARERGLTGPKDPDPSTEGEAGTP